MKFNSRTTFSVLAFLLVLLLIFMALRRPKAVEQQLPAIIERSSSDSASIHRDSLRMQSDERRANSSASKAKKAASKSAKQPKAPPAPLSSPLDNPVPVRN